MGESPQGAGGSPSQPAGGASPRLAGVLGAALFGEGKARIVPQDVAIDAEDEESEARVATLLDVAIHKAEERLSGDDALMEAVKGMTIPVPTLDLGLINMPEPGREFSAVSYLVERIVSHVRAAAEQALTAEAPLPGASLVASSVPLLAPTKMTRLQELLDEGIRKEDYSYIQSLMPRVLEGATPEQKGKIIKMLSKGYTNSELEDKIVYLLKNVRNFDEFQRIVAATEVADAYNEIGFDKMKSVYWGNQHLRNWLWDSAKKYFPSELGPAGWYNAYWTSLALDKEKESDFDDLRSKVGQIMSGRQEAIPMTYFSYERLSAIPYAVIGGPTKDGRRYLIVDPLFKRRTYEGQTKSGALRDYINSAPIPPGVLFHPDPETGQIREKQFEPGAWGTVDAVMTGASLAAVGCLFVPEPLVSKGAAGVLGGASALYFALRGGSKLYDALTHGQSLSEPEVLMDGIDVVASLVGLSAMGAAFRSARLARVLSVLGLGIDATQLGMQGVQLKESLDQIANDPSLSAEQKREMTLRHIGSMLASTALIIVSNKDAARDLRALMKRKGIQGHVVEIDPTKAKTVVDETKAVMTRVDAIKPAEVTPETARPTLEHIYKLDNPVGTQKSMPQRQACLQADTKITTSEAYTSDKLPKEKGPMKEFIKKPDNWVPERRQLHQKILDSEMKEALKIADRMGGDPPVVLMMRGNTASGKTYTLKNANHESIKSLNAIEPGKDPVGVLNPDSIKYRIISEGEGGKATSAQVHSEGSMLTEKLVDELLKRKKSMVLDKRFGLAQEVQDEVVRRAKEQGYKVVMIDVDADIGTSAERVLKRPVGGPDPNVPFAAVAHGYKEVRTERAKVAELEGIDEYYLFKTSGPKAGTLVAESKKGTLSVHDMGLWKEVTTVDRVEVESAQTKFGQAMDTKASSKK